MADVRAVAPAIEADCASYGMRTEVAQQLRTPAPLRCRLCQQHDGAVEPNGQHVVVGAQRLVDRAVLDVGPEPADPRDNRLAALGVAAELAGQREEPQGGFEV